MPEKIEESNRYELRELPTQTDAFIAEVGKDEVFTDKGLLVEILNKLDRIEKRIG